CSPQCGICDKNWPTWETIIKAIDKESFRVIGVNLTQFSSSPLSSYLDKHGISEFSVFEQLDPKVQVEYNLAMAPETLLINRDGKIEKVWVGLLTENDFNDVRQALGIR